MRNPISNSLIHTAHEQAWIDFIRPIFIGGETLKRQDIYHRMDVASKISEFVMPHEADGNKKFKKYKYEFGLTLYNTDKILDVMNMGVVNIIEHATMYTEDDDDFDGNVGALQYQVAIRNELTQKDTFANRVCHSIILELEAHLRSKAITTPALDLMNFASMEAYNDFMKRFSYNNLEVFKCPVTKDIITDPVVASDGITYDRTADEMSKGVFYPNHFYTDFITFYKSRPPLVSTVSLMEDLFATVFNSKIMTDPVIAPDGITYERVEKADLPPDSLYPNKFYLDLLKYYEVEEGRLH